MPPRTYTLGDATARLGYTSTTTLRAKYLDTDQKKQDLGFHYGAHGEVRLSAEAVDQLAAREYEARVLL